MCERHWYTGAVLGVNAPPPERPLTEEDVRRIVRELLDDVMGKKPIGNPWDRDTY
jgi:hypothetical protein